jgi:hypothetical protein
MCAWLGHVHTADADCHQCMTWAFMGMFWVGCYSTYGLEKSWPGGSGPVCLRNVRCRVACRR